MKIVGEGVKAQALKEVGRFDVVVAGAVHVDAADGADASVVEGGEFVDGGLCDGPGFAVVQKERDDKAGVDGGAAAIVGVTGT